jgi:hypothetical protein
MCLYGNCIGIDVWCHMYFYLCRHFVFIHLRLCHRYKNYTVVITIRLTIMKYPYLNWQWIFYFLCRCFLSSITAKTFSRLDCIYVKNGECYIRRRNCLPFASTWVPPGVLEGSVLLIFLFFYFVLLCIFTFWVPCCDVSYDFSIKMMFGSSLPLVICKRAHVLFAVFVFVFVCVWWCPAHIVLCFCFVFLRLVYHMLPVSLDCPFGIL